MSEQQILNTALDNLNGLTGATYTILDQAGNRDDGIDALIKIKAAKKESPFSVEIKQEVRQTNFSSLLVDLERIKGNKIIISQYIPKPLKEKLKDMRLNYLEVAGNCYIQTDELFIYINDQQVTQVRLPEKGKLWNVAGLKFLFAILHYPDLINASYRDIAHMAKIGLGNIGPLLQELSQEGYLKIGSNNGKKFKFLEQRPRLIQRWAELYRAVLRPKLAKGNFKFANQEDQFNWQQLPTHHYVWGGENAGALLTDYLFPEFFTVYTDGPVTKIMKELKIFPSGAGNLEILEQFWRTLPHENQTSTVPPLLAYAELMTSFDSRCRETAERIKAKYLE